MHFRNFQKLCPIFSINYIEKNSNAVSSWRNQHTQPGRRWVMPHVNIRQSAWIAIEYDIHANMSLPVHKMDIQLSCIRIHGYKSAAVACQESGRMAIRFLHAQLPRDVRGSHQLGRWSWSFGDQSDFQACSFWYWAQGTHAALVMTHAALVACACGASWLTGRPDGQPKCAGVVFFCQ